MKLTLEPTDRFQRIDGAYCRIWTEATDTGVPVHAYIRCVSPQTHDAEANALFDRELRSLPVPRCEAVTYDLRFLVD
ncbi:hypothetical protein CWB41_13815 [Methylovirgula ligni]|uniref:Uncharacterized protein n=1 Tax=Methylovirgula ligni TaxID=569860 RepID=A0A3D9YL31_9HYPH|nr:hypothetical protein [Methylovirgula ligni]QAY96670.1 hypothetical protein CWB41_13815 [Methylovirgula ligni]REF83290.1 hypothetical protein DES32_3206 [Methylovirgula ligni]